MFGYDPTYRTETQKIQIDPLLDSHSDNLFYFNSKLFTISKLGVQAFHLSIKRITLVEAINQQVEHRKASLLVNGDLKEQKMTAKQISATLARQLKPKELEQTLVQSIELIIDGSLSVKDMTELKRLTFSFRFAHQFLVHELKAIQFDREQLAKLVQLLNEQMHLASNQKIDIVFNWTGALFDAYFIAFNSLTNRTLLDLLKQIQRTLQDKIDLFQTQKQLQQSIRSSLETIPDDRGKIVVGLPDHKHLGYKLEEIYL